MEACGVHHTQSRFTQRTRKRSKKVCIKVSDNYVDRYRTGGPWHDETTDIGDHGYLGIEFLGDTGTHYGWIHIEEFAGVGGWFYDYAYDDSAGVGLVAGVIPEPSTFLLLVLGGTALLALRKRG
jgi:hypothetical protein